MAVRGVFDGDWHGPRGTVSMMFIIVIVLVVVVVVVVLVLHLSPPIHLL